jgi:hypothetical protein
MVKGEKKHTQKKKGNAKKYKKTNKDRCRQIRFKNEKANNVRPCNAQKTTTSTRRAEGNRKTSH